MEAIEKTILQMHGVFDRDADGCIVAPSEKDVRAVFDQSACPAVRVECVFSEMNFHHLNGTAKSPKHDVPEEEVFVQFESEEQACSVLGLRGDFRFTIPSKTRSTRASYRKIGELVLQLKQVDAEIRALGAVPGRGGIPVLPDHFVQIEQFDETVVALKGNMTRGGGGGGSSFSTLGSARENLHNFLVYRTRINRSKRQELLDSLVDKRIDVLLKLCSFDPDETPFTFDRGYFA
jgi:hypothetical protein